MSAPVLSSPTGSGVEMTRRPAGVDGGRWTGVIGGRRPQLHLLRRWVQLGENIIEVRPRAGAHICRSIPGGRGRGGGWARTSSRCGPGPVPTSAAALAAADGRVFPEWKSDPGESDPASLVGHCAPYSGIRATDGRRGNPAHVIPADALCPRRVALTRRVVTFRYNSQFFPSQSTASRFLTFSFL